MNYTGTQLRRLRKEKGWSQVEFAKKINVSGATISLWEKGQRKPSASHIKKICKIYSVTTDEILKPKKEEELRMCSTVEDYKDTLETKLCEEELARLGLRIFEEHTENMLEDAIKIINSNEAQKKQLLKELIGI